MPIPTEPVPEWEPPDENVDEPSAGRKAAGWVPSIPRPSGFLNWYWRGISRWVAYLRDSVAGFFDHHNADGSHLDRITYDDLTRKTVMAYLDPSDFPVVGSTTAVAIETKTIEGVKVNAEIVYLVEVLNYNAHDHPGSDTFNAIGFPQISSVNTGTRLTGTNPATADLTHNQAGGTSTIDWKPWRAFVKSNANGEVKVTFTKSGGPLGTYVAWVRFTPFPGYWDIDDGNPADPVPPYPYVSGGTFLARIEMTIT